MIVPFIRLFTALLSESGVLGLAAVAGVLLIATGVIPPDVWKPPARAIVQRLAAELSPDSATSAASPRPGASAPASLPAAEKEPVDPPSIASRQAAEPHLGRDAGVDKALDNAPASSPPDRGRILTDLLQVMKDLNGVRPSGDPASEPRGAAR